MNKKDKELLLKDLHARSPYGVLFKSEDDENLQEIHYIKDEEIYTRTYPNLPYWIETIKPYLRPMSSMTEEEKIIYRSKQTIIFDFKNNKLYVDNYYSLDYLNSIHVDYRGLIDKGIALEAPEGMYNLRRN